MLCLAFVGLVVAGISVLLVVFADCLMSVFGLSALCVLGCVLVPYLWLMSVI